MKNNKIIIAFIIGIFFIVISVAYIKNDLKLMFFQKLIKDGFLFIEKPIQFSLNSIESVINKEEDFQDDALYDVLILENKELKDKIEMLKETLELKALLNEKYLLSAVVMSRNINSWSDTIIIDKGSENGVIEGMPVVVKDGLIGKILKVSNFNSTVQLLTGNINKISVKIDVNGEYIYGLLSGYNEKDNTYNLEGISQTTMIENGSMVTTTGMGDIFPSGIMIGKVIGSENDSYDLSKVLKVKPSVNFDNLEIVTILKRNVDI